jgi:hypothetical protein
VIDRSERRHGADALTRSLRWPSELLARGEAAQYFHTPVPDVPSDGHRAQRAASVVDDHRVTLGSNRGARYRGDAPGLVAESDCDAASGE